MDVGIISAPMPQVTIDQAFQLAAQHHQAGRFAEAEIIYRQVLLQAPNHANALHMLGVLASQTDRSAMAIELISRAVDLAPNVLEYHCNLCEICRRAGQLDRAIAHGRSAIRLNPGFAAAHCNLGVALKDNGQLDEAIAAQRRAIDLSPEFAVAYKNLGGALHDMGRLDEAIAAYRRGVQLDPGDAVPQRNLGIALKATGRSADAIASFQRVVELQPTWIDSYIDLAAVLFDEHRLDEAIAVLRQAIQVQPGHAEAHGNLGNALAESGQAPEAIAAYQRAIEIKPSLVEAYRNLAVVLGDNDRIDESIPPLRQAIDIQPEYANAHSGLAVALAQAGELDEGIAAARRAVELKPGDPVLNSNLVYAVQFHPDYDAAAILAEARRWSSRCERSISSAGTGSFPNDRSPDRRLRVGYVSSDFSGHVVGRNVLPLLQNHHREEIESFCYHNSWRTDDITRKFRLAANHWRQIDNADDTQAVEMIRADAIDILVDLSLHLAHNRLPVFARKPAPVQVTFAGYPGTTGLEAIDYRLTDPFLDPPGHGDSFYSEASIRLPHSFWCYDPVAMHPADELPVAPLPALATGRVTFGCLNNLRKVTDRGLELWSAVLAAIPESRLILLAPPGNSRRRILHRLDARQVEFVDRQERAAYLKIYDRIDIGLDTTPYNGHTTSLDSLWMGVPVVTLVGRTVVSRAGCSQLCNLDLRELAAQTPEQFVEIATALAADLPRLSELRQGLRDRMRRSPLTDTAGFARDVEAAYRGMWKVWCSGRRD
jgi:protein O-GlcNAc transferase